MNRTCHAKPYLRVCIGDFSYKGDFGYCPPYVFSVYAGLMLGRVWNTQYLFGDRSFEFCKYRFGLSSRTCDVQYQAFHSVFNALIPKDRILPHIATASATQCKECGKLRNCQATYKKELEQNLSNVFKLRDYEEVQQIKDVINSIIEKPFKTRDLLDYKEIVKEFHEKERQLCRQAKLVFPKVKRFANIATVVSLPFAIAGLAAGSTLLTVAGASVAGIAQKGPRIRFGSRIIKRARGVYQKRGNCPFLLVIKGWINLGRKKSFIHTNSPNILPWEISAIGRNKGQTCLHGRVLIHCSGLSCTYVKVFPRIIRRKNKKYKRLVGVCAHCSC